MWLSCLDVWFVVCSRLVVGCSFRMHASIYWQCKIMKYASFIQKIKSTFSIWISPSLHKVYCHYCQLDALWTCLLSIFSFIAFLHRFHFSFINVSHFTQKAACWWVEGQLQLFRLRYKLILVIYIVYFNFVYVKLPWSHKM